MKNKMRKKQPIRQRKMKGYRNKGSNGITSQYDRGTQYSKKSMPGRKKRAWKRAIQKDRALDMRKIATQIAIKNSTLNDSFTTDTQSVRYIGLKGNFGTVDGANTNCGMRDLATIASNDGFTDGKHESFYLGSAILDVTYTNIGTTPLEVDVYDCIPRKATSHLGSPLLEMTRAEGDTPQIGAAASVLLSARGTTPFDFPLFARQGNTIMKKTKYFVSPNGGTFTYQTKDPRNHFISSQDILNQSSGDGQNYVYRNITQYQIIVTKKVAGYGATTASYAIGATRRYAYKTILDNGVRDAQF